jgi:hypothetical protein
LLRMAHTEIGITAELVRDLPRDRHPDLARAAEAADALTAFLSVPGHFDGRPSIRPLACEAWCAVVTAKGYVWRRSS